jgi:hypothetical protein
MPLKRALALLLGALVLSIAPSARADARCCDEASRTGPSASLLFGYGHEFAKGLQGLDFGVGASGGYTMPDYHLYFGGTLVAHFGSAERARASTYRYENLRSEYALSADVGYDALLGRRWVLRPMLSGGFLVDNAKTTIGTAQLVSHDVSGFIGPAGALSFRVGALSVGVVLRIPVFPSAFVSRLMLTGYLALGAYF